MKHVSKPSQFAGSIFATTLLISSSCFIAISILTLWVKTENIIAALVIGGILVIVPAIIFSTLSRFGFTLTWLLELAGQWLPVFGFSKNRIKSRKQYVVRMNSGSESEGYGERQPPSMEDVRDARLHAKTWVPSRARSEERC